MYNNYSASQYDPIITVGNENIVHHSLLYLCDDLNATHVGESGTCNVQVSNTVRGCRLGVLIAAWAIGGTVSPCSAFLYHKGQCCYIFRGMHILLE